MRFLLILIASPVFAALMISSAVVGVDGRSFTITMNGNSMSGSTANCFTFSGGAAAQFNGPAASATINGSGSTITVVSVAPAYAFDTPAIALSSSPTCAISGSTGNASSSNATATNGSGYYPVGDSHWTGDFQFQGSPLISTDGNGYPNTAQFNSPTGSIDFAVTSSAGTIALWILSANTAVSLYIDGVLNSRVVPGGSYASYQEIIFNGLDTGAHTFSLVQSGTGAPFSNADFQAIRIPGAVFTALPSLRPVITACGASIVDLTGGGSSTANADQNNWGLLKTVIGTTTQGRSYSGQTMYTTLRDGCPTSMVLAGGGSPLIGWLEPDPNDINAGTSLANERAAVQTAVTNIMANAHPPSKLFVAGIYPNTMNNSTVCSGLSSTDCAALYNGAIAAGVAAAANANTTFIHTQALTSGGPDWINTLSSCTGSNDTIDGVHPCAATSIGQPGYGKITNRQAPLFSGVINGSSFSISGPSSSIVGTASSPFTATIAGTGATWVDPITITSTVSSDTICQVGGLCSYGSLTIPASIGASSFGFTISAETAGARTLSYSGLADGWVAPSSNIITASSGGTIGQGNGRAGFMLAQ